LTEMVEDGRSAAKPKVVKDAAYYRAWRARRAAKAVQPKEPVAAEPEPVADSVAVADDPIASVATESTPVEAVSAPVALAPAESPPVTQFKPAEHPESLSKGSKLEAPEPETQLEQSASTSAGRPSASP
jgi:hypothetical protein